MTLPRSAADVLADHVLFEIEVIDRMNLNLYQPRLQHGAGIAAFFVGHRGHRFASSALNGLPAISGCSGCSGHTRRSQLGGYDAPLAGRGWGGWINDRADDGAAPTGPP